jgi:hypothetical protein
VLSYTQIDYKCSKIELRIRGNMREGEKKVCVKLILSNVS